MTTFYPALQLGADVFGAFGTGIYSSSVFGAGGATEGDITGPCTSISITRGVEADGLVEKLTPGVCTVVLRDIALSPVTDPRTRPGQPLRVLAVPAPDSAETPIPVFTGTISRAVLSYVEDDPRITLTAVDRVGVLANTPVHDTISGTYAQRIRHLIPTTIEYVVTDRQPDEDETTVLPGTKDGDKLLDALYLVRDTMHGIAYVSAEDLPTFIADRDRGRTPAALTLGEADYLDIEPAFDTDDLTNQITVEQVTDPETPATTYDLGAGPEWGTHAQTVTVNDGDPLSHAIRYAARIPTPGLGTGPIRLNPALTSAKARDILAAEPYDPIRVVLDGQIDNDHQILTISHTITPLLLEDGRGWFKWLTTFTSRRREVLPTMWAEVPSTITWADAPAGLDWLHAITWHPETTTP